MVPCYCYVFFFPVRFIFGPCQRKEPLWNQKKTNLWEWSSNNTNSFFSPLAVHCARKNKITGTTNEKNGWFLFIFFSLFILISHHPLRVYQFRKVYCSDNKVSLVFFVQINFSNDLYFVCLVVFWRRMQFRRSSTAQMDNIFNLPKMKLQ